MVDARSIIMANLTLLVGDQWTQRWAGTSLYYLNENVAFVLVGCAFPKKIFLKSRVMDDVWHDGSSPSLGTVTIGADIHIIVMFAYISEGICHCV